MGAVPPPPQDVLVGSDLLQALKLAVEAAPDPMLVSDADTLQLLYVNDAACRVTGYSREEMLRLGSTLLAGMVQGELKDVYRQAVERGEAGLMLEPQLLSSKDGSRRGWWEAHLRAVRFGERTLIVGTSREVTSFKLVEEAGLRARRMLSALSAINEAMLRAESPDQLFQDAWCRPVNSSPPRSCWQTPIRPGCGWQRPPLTAISSSGGPGGFRSMPPMSKDVAWPELPIGPASRASAMIS